MNKSFLKIKDKIRSVVPYPVKSIILKSFCNDVVGSFLGRIYSESIPHRGARIFVGSSCFKDSNKAMLWFGWYERSEIDQTIAYLDQGYDVIELGSSIGVNTTQILKHIGDERRLMAVEANPDLIPLLKENIKNNNPRNIEVTVVDAAVDYSNDDSIGFLITDSTLSGKVSRDVGPENCKIVKTIKLSDLSNQLTTARFILVADIEGAEVGMIINEMEFLKKRCFRIIIEIDGAYFGGKYYSIEDVKCLLEQYGFELQHRHANRMVFENA
ncbi:MAG: FkbM family methyltransferase [Deltaproteobacteria bacterium]|nr:MAG: FkbM family methyltransferase [Deltaproteobacteria bacterium]